MPLSWQVWLQGKEQEAKQTDESEQPNRDEEVPGADKKASQASGTLVDMCGPVSAMPQHPDGTIVALTTQPIRNLRQHSLGKRHEAMLSIPAPSRWIHHRRSSLGTPPLPLESCALDPALLGVSLPRSLAPGRRTGVSLASYSD